MLSKYTHADRLALQGRDLLASSCCGEGLGDDELQELVAFFTSAAGFPRWRQELNLKAWQPLVLRELDVGDNQVGDEGATALTRMLLQECVHLKILRLHKNRLGEVGAQAVADLIREAPGDLAEVHLSHNFLSPKAANQLLDAAAHRPEYPPGRSPPLWLRMENQRNTRDWADFRGGEAERCDQAGSMLVVAAERIAAIRRERGWLPSGPRGPMICMLAQREDRCVPRFCCRAHKHGPVVHLPYFWRQGESAASSGPRTSRPSSRPKRGPKTPQVWRGDEHQACSSSAAAAPPRLLARASPGAAEAPAAPQLLARGAASTEAPKVLARRADEACACSAAAEEVRSWLGEAAGEGHAGRESDELARGSGLGPSHSPRAAEPAPPRSTRPLLRSSSVERRTQQLERLWDAQLDARSTHLLQRMVAQDREGAVEVLDALDQAVRSRRGSSLTLSDTLQSICSMVERRRSELVAKQAVEAALERAAEAAAPGGQPWQESAWAEPGNGWAARWVPKPGQRWKRWQQRRRPWDAEGGDGAAQAPCSAEHWSQASSWCWGAADERCGSEAWLQPEVLVLLGARTKLNSAAPLFAPSGAPRSGPTSVTSTPDGSARVDRDEVVGEAARADEEEEAAWAAASASSAEEEREENSVEEDSEELSKASPPLDEQVACTDAGLVDGAAETSPSRPDAQRRLEAATAAATAATVGGAPRDGGAEDAQDKGSMSDSGSEIMLFDKR